MESQIDAELPTETSGPSIGKILVSRLREALGFARDESSAHGTAIEVLTAAMANKLDINAVANFATAAQGEKADNAILFDAATGKGQLPDGTLINLGGAVTPTILSVGNGSVTFEA